MKTLGLLLSTVSDPLRRWNVRLVVGMLLALLVMIAIYTVAFHELMELEGRRFSWATAVYWTLTVMSTLGFGDITFESDAGRLFSILVLLTGAMFILVLLPFVFIQFIFMPWMRLRESARAPRRLDDDVEGHVVLTALDVVTDAFIERAEQAHLPYAVVVSDAEEALRLHDAGYHVLLGGVDDPSTYQAARVESAALVATTLADTTNTNVAFTVRELSSDVPLVATATEAASVDILELAGCNQVLQLGELLGRALARRVVGGDTRSHVVGEFGRLRIAEAAVAGTDLVGSTLREADLRRRANINVVGVWQRGSFEPPRPDTELGERSVLILAGTDDQLATYDAVFARDHRLERPVVIIGGGRVGRAAGRALVDIGASYRIIEQRADRVRDDVHYVVGNAADYEVLQRAGFDDTGAVMVTTHEDDVNVYLTLYCRKLRPDVQLIARATRDRNVSTLHRAGADAVLSYASLGATALWNAMGGDRRLVVAEGLEVFQLPVPATLAGVSLAEAHVAATTGSNVVAVQQADGRLIANPDASLPLPADADLIVIGDEAAERRFLDRFRVDRHGAPAVLRHDEADVRVVVGATAVREDADL